MRFCNTIGIPHSTFLEEWSDEDRAKALAYMKYESQFCPSCGTAQWEWEEDKYAYEPVEEICPGCEKKDWLRDETDSGKPGRFISLKKPEQ